MKSTIGGYYPSESSSVGYEPVMKKTDQSRIASFFSYPYPSAIPGMVLAEAGFHYDGHGDAVVCRQCELKYSGWNKTDDPRNIHLTNSPKCPFFQTREPKDLCGSKTTEYEPGISMENSEKVQLSGACGGLSDRPVEQRIENQIHQQTNTNMHTNSTGLHDSNKGETNEESRKSAHQSNLAIDVSLEQNPKRNDSDLSEHREGAMHSLPEQCIRNTVYGNQMPTEQCEQHDELEERLTLASRGQSRTDNLSNTSHDSTSHTITNSDLTGPLETIRPKYQQFAILATRLSSYRNWPTSLNQRPEDLAKAGLFYEGTNDYARCFHCGGGLREWDPEDDPFYEHARWFPFCPFLRLIKGDKFIMGVQSGTLKPPSIQHEEPKQANEINLFEHPAVLSIMELGYSKSLLAKAITVYRKRHGADLSAERLLPVVWDIEDNDDADSVLDSEFSETDEINHIETEKESKSEDRKLETAQNSTHMTSIDELTEENRELREQKTCKVCLDEEASIVFLPCGHLVTCPMCASALRKCPVCRTYIRGTVKAIISIDTQQNASRGTYNHLEHYINEFVKKTKVMDNYLTRLATFFSFPFPSPVSTTALAEAGFHYTGNKDEVDCHICKLKYSGWQKHDIPLAIHEAMSPDCTFVLKTDGKMYNDGQSKSISLPNSVENQQEGIKCVTGEGLFSGKLDRDSVGGAVGGPLDHVTNITNERIRVSGQQAATARLPETDTTKCTEGRNPPQDLTDSLSPNSSSSTGQLSGHVTEKMNMMKLNIADNRSDGKCAHRLLQIDEPTIGSRVPERSGEDYPITARSEQEHVNDTETNVGIDSQISQELTTVHPRYPQFAILAVRLASYKNWPTNLRQKPEELAKAGLFYEGTNDYVRCFHCAGGLREWEPEDDPIIEHARWFPFCEFLRLIKGDQFIMGVQAGTIKAEPKVQFEKQVAPKQEYPFDHPAVLSVMEMGYKRETIAKAIQLFNKGNGNTLNAETLLSLVWEIVENDEYTSDDEQNNRTKEMILDEIPGKEDDVVSCEQHVVKDLDQLEEENRALRERKTCKVCLDEEASIVFLPCGHLVTCPMCASALRKCPICRSFIRGTVKAIVS
ncbi:uncharacterized protein LOC117330044 [Pecten maximus]|uniref:uncharacterized protein LOC117330044 n=1 Tax=Pecten maximus TaxID=6579 RepID=UPI001458FE19|nr:uncharacterized protein LOC117330044 [Pecten maximus]